MKKREKILAMLTGGIFVLLIGGYMAHGFFFGPIEQLDRDIELRSQELMDLMDLRDEAQHAQRRLGQLASRTYGEQVDTASAAAGARLSELIAQSGLEPARFTRTPISPRRIRGGVEIGWNVRGRDSLNDVVDLLYLINHEPYLHKVDALTLAPIERSSDVQVNLRYLSLVLEAPPATAQRPDQPDIALTGEERQLYDAIVQRNLFRPYIPPPPPRETPRRAERPTPPPREPEPQPRGPGHEIYRVVSLSKWQGKPEVHILDTSAREVRQYQIGDELIQGEIVMVDYRALPLPSNPALRSQSRLILKIDNDYWAVELGQSLADKYVIPDERMPTTLERIVPTATTPPLEDVEDQQDEAVATPQDAAPVSVSSDDAAG